MIKTARKPSPDPAQEKLRQHKADWNKEVSGFINDLIHLKKMMNGWPSKYFPERSKIIVPIPSNPNAIINQLAGRFQELAQDGTSIAQEQANYSKTRKLPRQQQATNTLNKLDEKYGPTNPQVPNPLETPPSPDVTKMLGASDKSDLVKLADSLQDKYLVSDGSNKLTRFLSRIKNPAIGMSDEALVRKDRMSMLSSLADIYRDLGKFQVEIVGKSPESIFAANQILGKIDNSWKAVYSTINFYVDNKDSVPADTGGNIAPPADIQREREKMKGSPRVSPQTPLTDEQSNLLGNLETLKTYVQDYSQSMGDKKLPVEVNPHLHTQFRRLSEQAYTAQTEEQANELLRRLADIHQKLLRAYNQRYGTSESSLSGILGKVQQQEENKPSSTPAETPPPPATASATDQMEKVAQDFLKKWLGRTYHALNPFDKTTGSRLRCYKWAAELRSTTNRMMNSLEKELDVSKLEPLTNQVTNTLYQMRNSVGVLRSTLIGKGFQDPFMNLLQRGLITEHAPNLTPEQKKKLEKSLEHRQVRELTQLYGRK